MPTDTNSAMRLFANAALLAGIALLAAPAQAGVKEGVDAWSRGDYAAALREWEAPAAAGDADALFNMAQAYRLGRGVAADPRKAESLYAKAAALGHVQAADIYGIMLFQDGRRQQALPFVTAAAARGDPRSQYLLGIAHFNGDLVSRDWVRAYALMQNANRGGLPQAAEAIAQMDQHIPLDQRQAGAGLARQLEAEAEAALARDLAAADLNVGEPVVASAGPSAEPPPQIASASSVGAAEAALATARQASGTEDPSAGGASYARPSAPPQRAPIAAAEPVRQVPAPAAATRSAPAATGGPWKVQLGAFSVRSNADNLWAKLSSRAELTGAEKLTVASGRVTRLLAAGYASKADANSACRALKSSGQDCIVTRD